MNILLLNRLLLIETFSFYNRKKLLLFPEQRGFQYSLSVASLSMNALLKQQIVFEN
jgi:hypothetical protein